MAGEEAGNDESCFIHCAKVKAKAPLKFRESDCALIF